MIRFGIVACMLLFATYAVLAGHLGETELLASIPATLIAVAFAAAHRRHARRSFTYPRGLIGFTLRTTVQIVPDTGRVAWALLRVVFAGAHASGGAIAEQPFTVGKSSPRDAARRAVTTLGVSLAPNGYVLRVFAAEDSLLLHRLVPASVSSNRKWPA